MAIFGPLSRAHRALRSWREHAPALGTTAADDVICSNGYLIEHGADVNAQNKTGITPLMDAVYNNNLDSLKILLAHGADVDKESKYVAPALSEAIIRRYRDVVTELLRQHLRRILTRYCAYYHLARTHLLLDKDAPNTRPIAPPAFSHIIQIPEVGGLHHRYERRAA